MRYLKKACPDCQEKKLFNDSQGSDEDGDYEEWIQCAGCEATFCYNEIGVERDGTLGFVLEEEYQK